MIVEKGTFQVLKNTGQLETESLGSCVALAALDTQKRIGGLWVFVLPAQKILVSGANGTTPTFFADQGLDLFLKALQDQGAEISDLQFTVVGGARFLEAPTVFDLGGLNISMIRKLFKDKGIKIHAEHVGGPFPRKVILDLGEGTIEVKSSEQEEEPW